MKKHESKVVEILQNMIARDDEAKDKVKYDVGATIKRTAGEIIEQFNKRQKEEDNKTYIPVKAAIRRIEEHERKHPVRMYLYRKLWQLIWFPGNARRYIIRFVQRGYRGYGETDIWNLQSYVASIVAPGVRYLRVYGYGLPTWTRKKTELQAVREWNSILLQIEHTFTTTNDIINGDTWYIPSDKFTTKKYRTLKSVLRHHTNIMNLKAAKEYERGFELFGKYFMELCD